MVASSVRQTLSCRGQGRRTALARIVAAGLAFGLYRPAVAGAYDDFIRALQTDDVQTLRSLQRLGFDFNTLDESGLPPLLLALRRDSLNAAAFLVEQSGFNLDAVNANDENALMIAALRGHAGLLRQLLQQGAEPNKPGWTPLHYAATHVSAASVEMIELLLDASAYIDAESPNGTTPLMMAARYGHRDAVLALIDAGADVALRNQQGLGALEFALRTDRRDIAELIARALRARSGPPSW
jgi:ankyrin repeat protein